jgi:hypothetical protein
LNFFCGKWREPVRAIPEATNPRQKDHPAAERREAEPVPVKIDPMVEMKTPPKIQVDTMIADNISRTQQRRGIHENARRVAINAATDLKSECRNGSESIGRGHSAKA